MSGVDTVNARAAADSVRKAYNPAEQWMGFGLLGPSRGAGRVATLADRASARPTCRPICDAGSPSGLTGIGAPINANYAAAGSAMAQGIACYTNSSVGTDLADPVTAAAYELMNNGRPLAEVTKGIILMSDGQPNNSTIPTGQQRLLRPVVRRGRRREEPGHRGLHDRLRPRWQQQHRLPGYRRRLAGRQGPDPPRRDGDRLGRCAGAPAARTTMATTSSASRRRPARART